MNPLHLLWIIPLSGSVGAFVMARMAVNNRHGCEYDHIRCKDCHWFSEDLPLYVSRNYENIWPMLETDRGLGSCNNPKFWCSPFLTCSDGYCFRARKNE